MGAKEFFYAIGMNEVYNNSVQKNVPEPDGHIYNRRSNVKNVSNYATRELGRYRSYVYREKMLKREILKLTELKIKLDNAEKINIKEMRYGCRKPKLINLWLELSKVQLKKRELELMCEKIDDSYVKNVVITRYFKNPERRLVRWAQTAKEMGLSESGEQVRKRVSEYLLKNTFNG